MEIIKTGFEGLYVLQTKAFKDERGGFQKLFNHEFFKDNGLDVDFKEFYYSLNKKNVVRGMHFQIPPMDHTKVVYVSAGRIIDVSLDIRKNSPTYGKAFFTELNAEDGRYMYIPKGFAHGFVSLEDGSICNYAQTTCYDRERDCGIDVNSFGFDWGVENPIRSGRDLEFPDLKDIDSPFIL